MVGASTPVTVPWLQEIDVAVMVLNVVVLPWGITPRILLLGLAAVTRKMYGLATVETGTSQFFWHQLISLGSCLSSSSCT